MDQSIGNNLIHDMGISKDSVNNFSQNSFPATVVRQGCYERNQKEIEKHQHHLLERQEKDPEGDVRHSNG